MRSEVVLYPGASGWHFMSLPKKQSADIKQRFGGMQRGWGSLPVEAMIGATRWTSSIFYDSKSQTYLLPLKVAIRKKENIHAGGRLAFSITLRV